MGLENADYIAELVVVNPDGGDDKGEGDDHIRIVKRALTNGFPGFVGTQLDPKGVTLTEDQVNDAALKSEANTFTDVQEHQASVRMANGIPIYARDSGGTIRFVAQVTVGDRMDFGDSNVPMRIQALSAEVLHATVQVLQTATRENGSLLVRDRNDSLKKVGYRNPQLTRSVSTSFTLTQDDEGQIIRGLFDTADRVITVPQLDGGTQITVTNRANLGIDTCIVTPGSGVTVLVMQGNDQYNATGEIRMGRGTVMHVQYESSTVVCLWGSGLSRAPT